MKTLRLLFLSLTLLGGIHKATCQLYDKYLLGVPTSEWKGVLLQVDQDSFSVIPFTDETLVLKTVGPYAYLMCDRYGNPRFFTNGNTIASWDNTIMANGRGLNEGAYSGTPPGDEKWEWPYPIPTYSIPDPADEQVFYILHQYLEPTSEFATSGLQITKIDMNARDGRGEVVYKNRFLHREWMGPGLCIIRHANGRDWWVVQGSTDRLHYLAQLLYRDSVVLEVRSDIEGLPTPADTLHTSNGPFTVSANGTVIADRYGRCTAKILDFDRCTGQVTLRDTFPLPCHLACPPSLPLAWRNLALIISPSGRYLYGFDGLGLLRWDLQAPDISQSMVELYGNDCRPYALPWPSQLLPNGAMALFASRFHSLIFDPDGPATSETICVATAVEPSCLGLKLYLHTSPFPNYRLGPLEGSPCDTLTLEPPGEAPGEEWTLSVGPSPAASSFTVRIGQGDAATQPTALRVYDVLGRRLYDLPLDEDNLLASHPIEVSNWAAGVYFVSLFSGKRILLTRKVVVAH